MVVGCWYRAEVRSPSSRIFPSDIRVFGGVLDSSELEEYLSYTWSCVPQIGTFHMREVEARSRRKTGQDSVTKVATGMTTALGGRGRAPPVLRHSSRGRDQALETPRRGCEVLRHFLL